MNSIQENDALTKSKSGRKRLPLKKRQPANMILEHYAIDAPSVSSPKPSTDASAQSSARRRSQSESTSTDSSKDENKTNLCLPLRKKKKRSTKSSASHSTSTHKTKRPYNKRKTDPSKNRGHWTNEEKAAFLNGLRKYGKGKWSKIASEIPTRTAIQVKTHAQGVLMKMENGEDVYEIGNPSTKSSGVGPESLCSNSSIASLSSSGAHEESTIPNSRTSSPSFEVCGTDNSVSLPKSPDIQNPDLCAKEEYADAIDFINDVVENSLLSSDFLNSFATPSATSNAGLQSILAPVTNSALINKRFSENTASVVNSTENETLHAFLTPVAIRATLGHNEGGVSTYPMSPLIEEKDQEMLSLAAKILLDLASPQGSEEFKA